jgi:hypothetical protein
MLSDEKTAWTAIRQQQFADPLDLVSMNDPPAHGMGSISTRNTGNTQFAISQSTLIVYLKASENVRRATNTTDALQVHSLCGYTGQYPGKDMPAAFETVPGKDCFQGSAE